MGRCISLIAGIVMGHCISLIAGIVMRSCIRKMARIVMRCAAAASVLSERRARLSSALFCTGVLWTEKENARGPVRLTGILALKGRRIF